jgi:hypothetical protein
LESILKFVLEFALTIYLEICHVGKNIEKNHGLPEFELGQPLGTSDLPVDALSI